MDKNGNTKHLVFNFVETITAVNWRIHHSNEL